MRALASVVVIVAAALLAIEITLSPTDRDRWVTLGVFATVAAITGLAGWLLPRFARRFRSLRTTVLLIAIAAVAVAAALMAAMSGTPAWGVEYFVAPGGSDGNGGTATAVVGSGG